MGHQDARAETHWVALLRGVNVGGVTVRSAPLAETFRALGFDDVRTVLASGNVVFTASGTVPVLKRRIEDALEKAFGYDAWIMLVPRAELAAIIAAYPFSERDDRHPYVVFGSDAEALAALATTTAAASGDAERVATGDGVLYWEAPVGSSTTTAFAKELAKKRYKTTTTTRNLRTLRKLL